MTAARTPVSADDILTIVTASDNATVAAVQDRTDRCFDVACSVHGRFYTFCYSRGATVRNLDWFRADVALSAAKHADTRHTPCVDSEGELP